NFRGRYRGRGGSFPPWKERPQEQPRPPSPPVGSILSTILERELDSKHDEQVPPTITNCEYIASYNWVKKEGESPTIMIPGNVKLTNEGAPPAWTPLAEPKQLSEDAGQYFRDLNSARYPKHPTEPAVRAVFAMNPEFAADKVDIFACGSTMGNLLRFVRKIYRPFRFLVEVVGDTVFFVRHENSPTETLQGVYGYGHTFPEAYTTWEGQTKDSESLQRIVQYDFSGLNCVVRYESDGYLKELDQDGDEVAEEYPCLNLDTSTDLNVMTGGRKIAQGAVFDLKTRSAKKMDQDVLGEEIQRLWISQSRNFVLAFHEWGVFREIRIQDIRNDIESFEKQHEQELAQLAALLRKISILAKARPDRKLEIRRKELDVLEVREQASGVSAVLPDELKQWWTEGKAVEKSQSTPSEPSEDGEISDERYFSPQLSPVGGIHVSDSDGEDLDYTVCSESCGYCGRCRH
ncbi:hypothetical protein HDK64DRAFT_321480, partial [Phyllosticta capitalensis]